LILLSSLPNEDYESFVLTLIGDKQSLSYNEAFFALVNHELRRKDKVSSNSTSTEALTLKDKSFNRKGKSDRERLKSRADFKNLKNQYALCKEIGH